MTNWFDIEPKDAKNLDLAERLDIAAPVNEMGERCPWPWEPQQLVGAPIGQYHCGYCGAMVLAGVAHLDYAGLGADLQLEEGDDGTWDASPFPGEQGLDDTPSSP